MKSDEGQILFGDCLQIMKDIPDGSIDMVCCDLPYQVLHRNNPHAQWDRMLPLDTLWEEYRRVTKPEAAIVLFAQGMFTARLMMSNPSMWRYNLVWDKCRVTGFLNANRMPLRCHEDICVFYRSLPVYHPQYEQGEPSHPQGKGKHKLTNSCYGKYGADYKGRTYESVPRVASTVPSGMKHPRSIVAIKKEHESTVFHPTQKPVQLIRWLIRTYTDMGGVVLDNTCGSGTTAVACLQERRKFVCIEKDDKYYHIACDRVRNELRQPKLFFSDEHQ